MFYMSQLVKDALLNSGCDPKMIGDLDDHSTIALQFHWSPTIYVSSQDDDIWLWCRLTEFHENNFNLYGMRLIQEQAKKLDFIRGDYLNLYENEGYLELSGLVDAAYLENGIEFAKALEGFLECADTLREVVK